MAKPVNIEITQGDTFTMGVLLRDATTTQPLDLSAATFTGGVAKAGIVVQTFNIVTTNNVGEIVISLTPQQTALLDAAAYSFDNNIPVTGANVPYTWAVKRTQTGATNTILSGVVKVNRAVI